MPHELKVHDGDRDVVLQFEHSLLSLSKWESKHKKAFLSKDDKLHTEMIDYFQDMLLEGDRDLVMRLSPEQLDSLTIYINDSQTASFIPPDPDPKPVNTQTITSELIYYWLVALRIPFIPTEGWHINRIMMLVAITNHMQTPPDKKSKRSERAIMTDWRAENERRLKMFKTTG